MPSFRRTPESSLFKRFWTPAFAGVTGRENVIIFGNCYSPTVSRDCWKDAGESGFLHKVRVSPLFSWFLGSASGTRKTYRAQAGLPEFQYPTYAFKSSWGKIRKTPLGKMGFPEKKRVFIALLQRNLYGL
jgi:hypothetical protein